MKQISRYINLILLFMLLSCETGILIVEPSNPELPIISTQGLRVAGALINSNTWQSKQIDNFSNDKDVPTVEYFNLADSCVIRFVGQIEDDVEIVFTLKNLKLNSFLDFEKLKDQQFEANANNQMFLNADPEIMGNDNICDIKGQLLFLESKIIDQNELILSGTFGFNHCDSEGKNVEVRFGRFDFKFRNNDNLIFVE